MGSTGKNVPQYQYKLVLLGESAVGKSSLVLRFVKGRFHESQESTIGAAFLTQSIAFEDHVVKYEIWDTAGQERYHSLAPMYYRNAQAAVIVYDIGDVRSFERAVDWIRELRNSQASNCVIALVGNKLDLDSQSMDSSQSAVSGASGGNRQRKVAKQAGQEVALKYGLLFWETSAKTGENVDDLFRGIAMKLPKGNPLKDILASRRASFVNTSSRSRSSEIGIMSKCCST